MLEEQITSYADFPNEETKYQQNMEEMKQLIPFLKEELKSCPNESLVFTLIETIDFYSLKRYFKLKSNSSSDNEELSKYKENLLANISNLDSFLLIPSIFFLVLYIFVFLFHIYLILLVFSVLFLLSFFC